MRLVPYKRGPRGNPSFAICGYREKMVIYEPESRSLLDSESAGTLTWAFPALRIMNSKFLLSISHSVYGIFL